MISNNKLEQLKEYLASMNSAIVAFSGGVDSSFLTKVAYEVLGDKVLAITAKSSTYPERELQEAQAFAQSYGIPHRIIKSEELDVEGFSSNPVNRCYLCKNELFGKITEIAESEDYERVLEGSNVDDLGDYRPGRKATQEKGVLSPLLEVGLKKDEIRMLSKEMGLKNWDKPAFACLSSRFPYGEPITASKLDMVDRAEDYLINRGVRQVRVRIHGSDARIEVGEEFYGFFSDRGTRESLYSYFQELGFTYVSLDLKGYRCGSMNEILRKEEVVENLIFNKERIKDGQ